MLPLVFFLYADAAVLLGRIELLQPKVFNYLSLSNIVLAVGADLVVFYDRLGSIESLTMYSTFQPIVRILFIYHEACILEKPSGPLLGLNVMSH
jgi:hypothetical protein